MLGSPEHDNLGLLREEEAGAEDRDAALSRPCVSWGGAGTNTGQGSACLKVFPKRRGVLRAAKLSVLVSGAGPGTDTPTQRAGAPDQHLARARLPAVLLHDAGLLHAPIVLVHDARTRLEEVFVEFWPTRGGVGKQWGTETVRSKTEAKVPS